MIFIILIIILSSITLALERPLEDPDSKILKILSYIDISTTSIFLIEAIIKILAFGFLFNGKNSYLLSTWN